MDTRDIAPWNWLKRRYNLPIREDYNFIGDEFERNIWKIYDEFFKDFSNIDIFLPRLLRGDNSINLKVLPRVDISENDQEYIVEADLPGVKEEDLDISSSNDTLTIKGNRESKEEEIKRDYHLMERSYGSFDRTITLPENIELEKINAIFENGIVKIKIPKKEPKAGSSRKIKLINANKSEI